MDVQSRRVGGSPPLRNFRVQGGGNRAFEYISHAFMTQGVGGFRLTASPTRSLIVAMTSRVRAKFGFADYETVQYAAP